MTDKSKTEASPNIMTHGHFINGRPYACSAGRYGEVYNPATGAVTARVALGSRNEVEQAIAAAREGLPRLARHAAAKRARVMFRLKALLERNADEICALITAEHGKVLERCRGRAAARHRERRVRLRRARTAQGRAQQERRPRHRLLERIPAARRGRRHHALQLPGHGAAVDVAHGGGLRQHLRPQALRARPRERAVRSPNWPREAGLPPGCSTWSTATRRRSMPCSTTTRVQAVSFVGSTAVAEYIYSTGTANGKRVQALGGAKNHAVVMPDADLDNAVSALMGARLRLLRASAAWPSRWRWRWATTPPTPWSPGSKAQIAKLQGRPRHRRRQRHGPPGDARHTSTRSPATSSRGVNEGAELVVDGRGLQVPGHEEGFFLGGVPVRPGDGRR